MRDRILRTTVGAYKITDWWGSNTSGIQPVGDMVLVLPDEYMATTPGGIVIPEAVTDQNAMAAESGTLIACGSGAFAYTANGRPWVGPKPMPGDRVRMQRYSGQVQAGHDTHAYRLMTDTCIGAVESAAAMPVDVPFADVPSGIEHEYTAAPEPVAASGD